jgi:FKBP-type peptidyl-prolyl cis-trans isomerase (trigger factor)
MNVNAQLTWKPHPTFELEFSLPWAKVKQTYDQVVNQLTAAAEIKGFRKGKAPKDLVEKQLDRSQIYGEVINRLLPGAYAAAVKQHGLKPALSPKITIISAETNQPWKFKAESCELPAVRLGDYRKTVKGALAQNSLWTPAKGKPADKPKPLTDTQKLNLIARALINDTSLELPEILVDSERDRLLSKLVSELQKLNLTLEQYAQNNQKTLEQIRQEYAQTAANTLKLELILQAIADDRKIQVEAQAVDQMIAAAGDPKLKQQLNTPAERAYITAVLRKKQAIDFLLSLG